MTIVATYIETLRVKLNHMLGTARVLMMHGMFSMPVSHSPTIVVHLVFTVASVQTIELGVGAIGTERLYKDRRPMVITILDVFHQLHCLVGQFYVQKGLEVTISQNKIRKALYNGEFLAEDNAKEKMHVGEWSYSNGSQLFLTYERRALRRLYKANHPVSIRLDATRVVLQRASRKDDG